MERVCRPGAIFTAALVAEMNDGENCEASVEVSAALRHPPALTVTRLAYEPGLATAQVLVGRGRIVPLDLVRDGGRWLISFSNGDDPFGALAG